MTATTALTTAADLIARHAEALAYVTEEPPATNLADLAEQASIASERLENAGIQNADDLETAATYLEGAADSTGTEQAVLLNRAANLLHYTRDMADDYRDMGGN